MRFFWRILFGLAVCGLLLSSAACVRSSDPNTPEPDPEKEAAEAAIRAVFEQKRRAVLEGDVETAHELNCTLYRTEYSLEEFRRLYEDNAELWRLMWLGARIDHMGVEANRASVAVTWGDGSRNLVVYLREATGWKEENVVDFRRR